ncbi:MAG: AMP-binding protein, partial [Leptolyngbyaceae cyanobacterium HOT.MB2.61]|nr:AMP-binding protein [Leptolyngbyaceae cyanobacterium HOT.MB2.61]
MVKQLSLEQMVDCGMDQTTAITLLSQMNHWLASLPATECWQQFMQQILQPDHPFALHQLLYKITFSDWNPVQQGPPPVWIPSAEQIQATNIAALIRDIGVHSYPELHAWSAQCRAEFWHTMIQQLGIRFKHNYDEIVDLSQGVEFPKWLVNARLNITESCFQAADDTIAIISQSEAGPPVTLTYGELQALANRVANGLGDAGFQPGDAIAIAMPMTAESVAIYLGVIQAGCVVVSIADSFAASEIAIRLRLSKAKAIFTQDWVQRSGKRLPLYSRVVEAKAPGAIVLPLDSATIELRPGDVTWEQFLSTNEQFEAVPAEPSAHTNVLFSSGTTGEPKAIPWTHTTPIKCASDAYLHHDIHPGDVLAWYTNLGWMMGPWLIYASLINRATIALYCGPPTERGFGQFIQDAGVTMLGVVPSLVNTWKTTQCMHGLDWSTIKTFSSTGECSNPQDMLYLMALAGYKPIIEYCGGTEIGGGYITGTLVQPCSPATFTTPALGLDIVILDEMGNVADKGEVFLIPPSIGLSTELLNKDHHEVYFANIWEAGVGRQQATGDRQQAEVRSQEVGDRDWETGDQVLGNNSKLKPSITPNPQFLTPIPSSPPPPLRRHGD